MKKLAGVFISLYLMCTISGIFCDQYDTCKSLYKKCSSDCECCYSKCSFSWLSFRSYCNDNTNFLTPISSFFSYKDQTGMCSYNTPKNMTINDRMYKIHGLNAAHAQLKPGTQVEVILRDKKLMVTINDYPSTENGVILELSRETAKVFNIEDGGKIPCTIVVPRLENSSYYKYLNYVLPYMSLFSLLFKMML
ncbi:uncharacterized protein LOC100167729 precursor [Acyrthosiphon pisum]|uniref:ACYPI008496 protein n=1 Tax=Acyrthosiphon pisum TaxID=7029 RepID=C4WWA9_ACYPI|nr:uncharacterized protein LOC100167729 precursor [Acyrthosiphon pisum]BAH72179.1 ACYPI008496 [Acyrthosiphon pisum]|eukprot:NP_001155763.1 uncharacterized protein LOC100167729 precursor [Acyrthosiphon pisum]